MGLIIGIFIGLASNSSPLANATAVLRRKRQ